MLSATRSRALLQCSKATQASARRAFSASASALKQNVSKTNEVANPAPLQDKPLQESVIEGEKFRSMQEPNRVATWSRNQQPRAAAMTGPRFEQTIMQAQPAPHAAIELIHKQPVRWTHERVVECDGGGGPLGHPRIFINVDKPEIVPCTYCGLPYANEHHRHHLESLPKEAVAYPLEPQGNAAEVPETQRITDEALGQR
ncbi:hypothetical protein F5884DRAFT_886071 [Xylogone sp. PMI_703]|nr:hypothetical protein F5884DRAFT_886071 [Xylogone sp. PMI_703]